MLTIGNRDVILSDADNARFASADAAVKVKPDKRHAMDECECGKPKRKKADRCPICAKDRSMELCRQAAKRQWARDKKKKESLNICGVCSVNHHTIFEYAGLDLCGDCANKFIERAREDAIRKDNERIVNERDGTSTKINDGQAGPEVCDVHKRREAC